MSAASSPPVSEYVFPLGKYRRDHIFQSVAIHIDTTRPNANRVTALVQDRLRAPQGLEHVLAYVDRRLREFNGYFNCGPMPHGPDAGKTIPLDFEVFYTGKPREFIDALHEDREISDSLRVRMEKPLCELEKSARVAEGVFQQMAADNWNTPVTRYPWNDNLSKTNLLAL